MIRHKATGTELAWRPTWECREAPDKAASWALSSAEDRITPVYAYSASPGSCVYSMAPGSKALWKSQEPQTKESMLAKAVELGVVEIIPDEPPAAVTSADAPPSYVDHCLIEDARALAIRLFLAGHDEAAAALRRLL